MEDSINERMVIPGAIYLEFNELEGKIECYDKNQKHLGTIESETLEYCRSKILNRSMRGRVLETTDLNLYFCCNDMKFKIKKNFILIDKKLREYHLSKYIDNKYSHTIKYCPWCGKKLMDSLAEAWWDEIAKMFRVKNFSDELFNISDNDLTPREFDFDEWWINREL